jgi:hypothetical protein
LSGVGALDFFYLRSFTSANELIEELEARDESLLLLAERLLPLLELGLC